MKCNSKEKTLVESKAVLYPRCYLKRKVGAFLSLFFKEIVVLTPSELDKDKIDNSYFEEFSLKVSPWIPKPMGDAAEDLQSGIKALTTWGEQLGLGQSVSFETFYSALSSSQDEEVRKMMSALKGENKEDIITASRAFLALSLEADKREDELDAEIEKVDEQARRISQLVEDPSLLPEQRDSFYYIEPVNKARERMKAWARLAFSESGVPKGAWPVGESIDVKDLMDSAFESLSVGGTVLDVLSVYIPLEEDVLKDENLIFKVRSIFSKILALLMDICDGPALTSKDEFFDMSKALEEALDSKKWEAVKGPRLILSLYPGFSWQQIMAEAAKIKDEGLSVTPDKNCICASFFIV